MDNNQLNALCNDMLTAYLDQSDTNGFADVCLKYNLEVGSGIFHKAIDRVVSWVENGEYDLLTPENRTKQSRTVMNEIVKQHGGVWGKDISISADGGFIMSNDLMAKVSANVPPAEIEKMRAAGHLKSVSQDPYELLEKQLDVPFFASLESIAKLRVQTMNDSRAGDYYSDLIWGLEMRHPWLESDHFFLNMAVKVFGDRLDAVTSASSERENLDPETNLSTSLLAIDDILTAVGRTDRHYSPDGEMLMTKDDLIALDKVWQGNKMRPALLADILTKK